MIWATEQLIRRALASEAESVGAVQQQDSSARTDPGQIWARIFLGGWWGRLTAGIGVIICVLGLESPLLAEQPSAISAAPKVLSGTAALGQPPVHFQHEGILSPGHIAAGRLPRGGPVVGYFQPVEIKAPIGVSVALAEGSQFGPLEPAPVRVGLLIGPVYRLRVTNIPRHPGEEVYPTIELIDRLYAPLGQEARFAIPIQLHQEDLELALAGKLVTRIIYLEDPQRALPVAAQVASGENWFEAPPGQDPLAVADQLGRPVAILRIGGRVPLDPEQPEPEFMGPAAPYQRLPPRMRILQPPPRKPNSTKEAGQ
ncbi:MAG: hypothetical protein NZ602_00385 [Thermoguttaceae bacterium]|nr:hypothetical protein [Thermoguttaceae bacterium]MDW8037022.1 hypothetical protein [Thermoguttaceae bacterium]